MASSDAPMTDTPFDYWWLAIGLTSATVVFAVEMCWGRPASQQWMKFVVLSFLDTGVNKFPGPVFRLASVTIARNAYFDILWMQKISNVNQWAIVTELPASLYVTPENKLYLWTVFLYNSSVHFWTYSSNAIIIMYIIKKLITCHSLSSTNYRFQNNLNL